MKRNFVPYLAATSLAVLLCGCSGSGFKKTFGLDMTIGHISNCKSTLMRKKSKKTTDVKVPAAPIPNNGVAPAKAEVASGRQVSLQDVQTLKGLVGRVGGGDLKSLIDLLG